MPKKRFSGTASTTDSVKTPQYLLDYIVKRFGKFYDPCPYNINYNEKEHKNGLTGPWKDFNFCNPPFSRAMSFVKKAHYEFKHHKRKSIILGKCIWLSRDYSKDVMPDCELLLVGKLKFVGYEKNPGEIVIL